MDTEFTPQNSNLDDVHDLISKGNVEEAVRNLEDRVAANPRNYDLYPLLCRLKLDLGSRHFPKEWVLHALSQDPDLNEGFLDLATRLYHEKLLAESSDVLEALIWHDPDNHVSWNDFGVVRFAMEDLATAENALDHALVLNAGFASAIMNMSALFMATQRPRKAVRVAMTALAEGSEITPDEMHELGKLISKEAPDEAISLLIEAEDRAREMSIKKQRKTRTNEKEQGASF
jgi:tetratricopeptide (TPR) repeat protein